MTYIPNTTATINKNERCSLIGNPGLFVLPLGFGTGGLFLATVSTIPNRKAITIKKAFTIVFILVLKNNVKFYSTTHKSLIDTVKLQIYQ